MRTIGQIKVMKVAFLLDMKLSIEYEQDSVLRVASATYRTINMNGLTMLIEAFRMDIGGLENSLQYDYEKT